MGLVQEEYETMLDDQWELRFQALIVIVTPPLPRPINILSHYLSESVNFCLEKYSDLVYVVFKN